MDGWEGEDKSKAKLMARIQHLRRAWSKMRRRFGLSGVLDDSGQVCTSPTASAEALRDHWAAVFAAKEPDRTLWPEILAHAQPIPLDSVTWKLDADEFCSRVRFKHHSAPGEDGIPYGCWNAAGAPDILYAVYEELYATSGGTVTPCMRRGRMCFLPKDFKDDENPAKLVRSPEKTRPSR